MDVETYISENLALHRKLESKEEALIILSHELAKCKEERDELKKLFLNGSSTSKSLVHFERYGYVDSDAVKALNDKNKALFIEIRDLRHKLQNAYTDLKVLRAERWSKSDSLHQKEELVQEVEEAKAQLKELRSDLQALLDEKEELITERDAYRCKVHRLNHELAMALKASPSLDVDAVLMESRYMKERLDQALTEIEITKHMLSKYKGMLDKKKLKGAIKLGANDEPRGRILTHKQVVEFLEKEESVWQRGVMNKEATLSDLRGLCMALVDSLQDKSLCLMHQKKANKLIAERVRILEERLSKYESSSPSQILLEGYSNASVDSLPPLTSFEKQTKETVEKDLRKALPCILKEEILDDETSSEKLPKELEDLVNKALLEVQLDEENVK
ncbi:unnamed protein product [Nezara viridula]|uniref:Coiled-coil domain-containing protein 149 n=1 Tax=Nezara viridula TaxID=85310 RepID=A0A9P0HGI9_NEZVI|nr:unnamed protein product [Nezara viridula]